MNSSRRIRTVLFDLDGTLLDTAPDMAAALNCLLTEQGLDPLPYQQLRSQVSHGSRGLVETGFGADLDAPRREQLISRFLELYAGALAVETNWFDGVEEVLELIDRRAMKWGIVTNKPGWLTEPLLEALQLDSRPGCVVCGDALPRRKPHPDPLQHAAVLLDSDPAQCIYVGDAERDIEAGRAAGMLTLVADYGYIGAGESPADWRADGHLSHPRDLLAWLDDAMAD